MRIALVVVCALLLAVPARAGVPVPRSGWEWGHPSPQGSNLRAIDFAPDGTGYAVGNDGAGLRTIDGGTTWTGLNIGTTEAFTQVQAISRDVVVVQAGVVRRSDDGGRTFRVIYAGGEDSANIVHFADAANGYVITRGGAVLRTADGGRTFAGVSRIGYSYDPPGMIFTSPEEGWLFTNVVQRTVDGGRTWTRLARLPVTAKAVELVEGRLYVAGDHALARSDDGGFTWSATPARGSLFNSISCGTRDHCVMTRKRNDRLLRTEDGGATIQTLGFSRRGLDAVAFAGPARVLAVGERGTILRSDDSGGTFGPVSGEIGVSFRFGLRLGPVPGSVFALGREGTIARSTDGGNSWRPLSTGSRSAIVDASFSTLERGHAVDWTGRVFRTTDGGTNWTPVATRRARAVLEVRGRTLLATRSGIEHFDRAGRAVFAYGPDRILRSTDAGRTWRTVRGPRRLKDLEMLSATDGYALDEAGRVWKHERGRWTELAAVGTGEGLSLAFGDRRSGFLALDDYASQANPGLRYMLHTDDGGRTWRPQWVGPGFFPSDGSVVAESARRAYAVVSAGRGLGGYPGLLRTRRGGDTGTPTRLTLTRVRLRGGRLTIAGRLTGARGGEEIVLGVRTRRWGQVLATAGRDGRFRVSFNHRGHAEVVAQWVGDADRRGAGSRVMSTRR